MDENHQAHDLTDSNIDEDNTATLEEVEFITGTEEVLDAEDAAIHSDNESARQASGEGDVTDAEISLEKEIKELDDEMIADEADKKHKNRESTSEKAKRSTRQSTSEKAKESEEAKTRQLDPLRLRGKQYRTKVALVERQKQYSLEEAIELVKQTTLTKFDSAVELHIKVKGENVRGVVVLPNGNGKTRKVAVASDELIEDIAAGKLDFDVLLATPAMMPKLAKYAKVLGPKGLMPSPKAGTVTDEIEKVKAEISGGRIEYRADKTGVVHMSIGKVSFDTAKIVENYRAVEAMMTTAKVASISLASTMGPGVKVVLA